MRSTTGKAIWLSAWVVTGLLMLPLTGFSADETTTKPVAEKEQHERRHERHPEIHKAMRQLEKAKADLQEAAHDFGGHRVKAIQAIDQALTELHLALQADKS